jgi:hypothetical protein
MFIAITIPLDLKLKSKVMNMMLITFEEVYYFQEVRILFWLCGNGHLTQGK